MCAIATARSGQTAGNFCLSDNPQMNAVLGTNLPPFGFFGKAEPQPSRIQGAFHGSGLRCAESGQFFWHLDAVLLTIDLERITIERFTPAPRSQVRDEPQNVDEEISRNGGLAHLEAKPLGTNPVLG